MATIFCKIFTLLLSYVVPVKSKVKILQNFVAFSEYMNFKLEGIGFHKKNITGWLLMNKFCINTGNNK